MFHLVTKQHSLHDDRGQKQTRKVNGKAMEVIQYWSFNQASIYQKQKCQRQSPARRRCAYDG